MIFFDLDGTLLDHATTMRLAAEQFYRRFSSSLTYTLQDFLTVWDQLGEKYADVYFRGEISWEDQRRFRIREVFQDSEPNLSDQEVDARFSVYLRAYEKNWVLFSDVKPCLEALRDQRLGIITNGTVLQQSQKLDCLQIRHRFSTIVISEAIGVSKPDPQIFLEACRLAEEQPEDCIYVGDRLDTDARASCAVGMRGVWIDRQGVGDSRPVDVEVIRSLTDLPALVL